MIFYTFHSSVLQRVRGTATVGLCYLNSTTAPTQANSDDTENTAPQNEVRNRALVKQILSTNF